MIFHTWGEHTYHYTTMNRWLKIFSNKYKIIKNIITSLFSYKVYLYLHIGVRLTCRLMVFNATFNNTLYFSYIIAISFIGGGNWSTRRKALTYHKSLKNFMFNIVVSSTPCHQRDSINIPFLYIQRLRYNEI